MHAWRAADSCIRGVGALLLGNEAKAEVRNAIVDDNTAQVAGVAYAQMNSQMVLDAECWSVEENFCLSVRTASFCNVQAMLSTATRAPGVDRVSLMHAHLLQHALRVHPLASAACHLQCAAVLAASQGAPMPHACSKLLASCCDSRH